MKVSCPQCSAKIKLKNPESFVKCEFCGNSIYIDIDDITPVYTYKANIEPDQIIFYLKRDFEKIGFNENIKIIKFLPVYFPFWQVKGEAKLERGSSQFFDEIIKSESGTKIFFNASDIDYTIEIIEIDTQPETEEKRILFYIPYFKVDISFKGKAYRFFVNAANGEVSGNPIPYMSDKETKRIFPLFLLILITFLIINYFFDTPFLSIALNIAAFFIFYKLSIKSIEQKLYKR